MKPQTVPFLSIISPVYKAENLVDRLVQEILEGVSAITDNFEIILVEDGSPDLSWKRIVHNCEKESRVKGIKLSRNFGQHYAVTAGIEVAKGEVIVLMDCDLQDNPMHINLLLQKYKEGYDIVFTRRAKRKHPFDKAITAKIYNSLFAIFSDKNYDVNVGSLVMFSRQVRGEFLKIKDKDRLYIQMLKWVGFKHVYLTVEHRERAEGQSSYTFGKLLKMALQGWTSYSDKLLKLSAYIGFFFSSVAFLAALMIVFMYFYHGFQSGWASIFVLILFSSGLILMSIGVAGVYIGKTFEQSKDRPLYIIDQRVNIEDEV